MDETITITCKFGAVNERSITVPKMTPLPDLIAELNKRRYRVPQGGYNVFTEKYRKLAPDALLSKSETLYFAPIRKKQRR